MDALAEGEVLAKPSRVGSTDRPRRRRTVRGRVSRSARSRGRSSATRCRRTRLAASSCAEQPCGVDSRRRISSIPAARAAGRAGAHGARDGGRRARSALPIARVTVTWPASTRSRGRPATASSGSGSSDSARAAIARRAVVASLTFTLFEGIEHVLLQRDEPAGVLHRSRSIPAAGARANPCPTRAAGRGPPAGIRAARREPEAAAATRPFRSRRRDRAARLVDELRGDRLDPRLDSAIRLGVKAFVTSPRIRSCSGGSISMMYGIAGQPCASTSSTSAETARATTSALRPTIRLVILDDGEDVLVPGHDPEVELRCVEHRLRLASAGEDGKRSYAAWDPAGPRRFRRSRAPPSATPEGCGSSAAPSASRTGSSSIRLSTSWKKRRT